MYYDNENFYTGEIQTYFSNCSTYQSNYITQKEIILPETTKRKHGHNIAYATCI
jgi:hypothetical protein